ncbi:UDP-glucose dehydrogenase family protein [Cytobacillus oceanisediminis]|uniref:UDP-glucose 6-dehydrogenase n=1 Tax=Cytobacillus oceanisediminis 2691 TaxID=1196031 RepID=A0A160MG41_9BACI|nr:UDP-glucose/GDP-mannose dehydrogenase family protein [Cytobacillus oceanisediminis]AND42256.1 UDP-glucose 6-dehydrogenase [Cytobacillus oceanisediminis 2691]
MKIAVVGTGYVGLVTGVALSEIGHYVTCIDIDEKKVANMRAGKSPIYEPGLEELMQKNIHENRLFFTTDYKEGFQDADAVYIAVGTPQKADGSADLIYVDAVANSIAEHAQKDLVVVTKSTVPVGTNHYIKQVIDNNLKLDIKINIVSNPEFLREGSAVYDTFNGDRIVIGADSEQAANLIEEVNKPFGIPVFKTDVRSAEMIKYASNAFLATKISFINEIANICEKVGADVIDVARGMGQDSRIGSQFLNAGIGYGGSCFPKDTHALVQIAQNVNHDFELLQSVINVNNNQQQLLVSKAIQRFGNLGGKRVALLGLAFKPNTDDMREAPSIIVSDLLVKAGAAVIAYDPIAADNAKNILNSSVQYADSLNEALADADIAFIMTDWEEIVELKPSNYSQLMKNPVVFDGRNVYDLEQVRSSDIEYHSIGRASILNSKAYVLN